MDKIELKVWVVRCVHSLRILHSQFYLKKSFIKFRESWGSNRGPLGLLPSVPWFDLLLWFSVSSWDQLRPGPGGLQQQDGHRGHRKDLPGEEDFDENQLRRSQKSLLPGRDKIWTRWSRRSTGQSALTYCFTTNGPSYKAFTTVKYESASVL